MASLPSIAVIGLGNFGGAVAEDLAAYGHHVIGIDIDERRVNAFSDTIAQTLIADARDEDALRDAGVDNCETVVIAIGENLEANLLCAMNVRLLEVAQVWVKSRSRNHRRILTKIGAHTVVNPEKEMGRQVAQRIHNPFVADYMSAGRGQTVVSFSVPDALVGQPVDTLKMKERFKVECLGILRGTELIRVSAAPVMETEDTLLLLGRRQDLHRFGETLCR